MDPPLANPEDSWDQDSQSMHQMDAAWATFGANVHLQSSHYTGPDSFDHGYHQALVSVDHSTAPSIFDSHHVPVVSGHYDTTLAPVFIDASRRSCAAPLDVGAVTSPLVLQHQPFSVNCLDNPAFPYQSDSHLNGVTGFGRCYVPNDDLLDAKTSFVPFGTVDGRIVDSGYGYIPTTNDTSYLVSSSPNQLHSQRYFGESQLESQTISAHSTGSGSFADTGSIGPNITSPAASSAFSMPSQPAMAVPSELAAFDISHGDASRVVQGDDSIDSISGQSSQHSNDLTLGESFTVTKTLGQKQSSTIKNRVTCVRCKKTFSREADLVRHGKKHNLGEKIYQCGVNDCGYGGTYRRDKLGSHLRNCHSKALDFWGTFTLGRYGFPPFGDCLFSWDFLQSEIYARRGDVMCGLSNEREFPLESLLSVDGKGLKRLTSAIVSTWIQWGPSGNFGRQYL